MNKPVAWTNKYNLKAISEEGSGSVWSEPYFNGDVPLYLHAEKTLTDEEIEQVRVAIMGVAYWCADENMPEAYNAVKVCCAQVLGILVKAQEK